MDTSDGPVGRESRRRMVTLAAGSATIHTIAWSGPVSGPEEQERRAPSVPHDGGSPRPYDVERALRAAVSAPRTPGADPDAALREALVRICQEARREGIPVERVLVHLKHLWHEAADAEEGRTRISQERLSRLISACIVSYFD